MAASAACAVVRAERPVLEVADIFRAHGALYRDHHPLRPEQRRAMLDIERCRTAALGGHLDHCERCGYESPSYNSCRNRHCPKCQSLQQARWIDQRMERILPTPYFHVVFTLPGELQALVLYNRKRVFDLLFQTVNKVLATFGRDERRLGATLGFTAVLHTWTRDLRFHPHLHCIVTAGGLSLDREHWIPVRHRRFLFPVRALGALFRGKFMDGLRRAFDRAELDLDPIRGKRTPLEAFESLSRSLFRKRWVVYAKQPFGGPKEVYRYLGQYTHRVGISNHRLLSFDERGVSFKTRNGATTAVGPDEFIQRFLLHVLPPGFIKIRHYGLLASSSGDTWQRARELLDVAALDTTKATEFTTITVRDRMLELTGVDIERCPRCKLGELVRRPLPERELGRPPPTRTRTIPT